MVETMRMFLAIHEGKLPISIANPEVARKRLLAQDNIGIIPAYASLHRSNQHFNQDEDVFDVMHYDDLRRWAAHNGHDKTKVDQAVNNSFDLQIIKDLSNNDKHGYPPRNCGYSCKCPKLIAINRVMQLKTQAKKNSTIGMTLSAQGIPMIFGDGTAKAIITGDVLDNDNNRIGDFYEIANRAVEAWEQLLNNFGLNVVSNGEITCGCCIIAPVR